MNLPCHFTCLTCNNSSFNSCLSCQLPRMLVNSVCQCQPFSDKVCSSNMITDYYQPFDFLQTFFSLYLVFTGFMYMLNVKLKYTYRIYNLLQICSYILNMNIYLNGQTQYFLRILYRSNGGFFLPFRFSTFSVHNSVCSGIVLGILIIIFLSQYWLTISYIDKSVITYQDYLLSNIFKFIQTIYFLQGKYYILFIVQTILNLKTAIIDGAVGPSVVQIILVLFHLGYTIYLYKKQMQLNPIHYPRHFSFYITFAPLAMIILPVLPDYGWIICVIPIGLLILVLTIGRQKQELNRWSIMLYSSQVVFCCVPLGIIFIEGDFKGLYCLVIVYILLAICIVQCAINYFSKLEIEDTQNKSENNSIQSHCVTQQNINVNATTNNVSALGVK